MFTLQKTNWMAVFAADTDILFALLWIPLSVLFMFPLGAKLPKKDSWVAEAFSMLCYGVLLVVCLIFIISSSYNPFIYFRF